jgi:large subunit ribosomal protein L3
MVPGIIGKKVGMTQAFRDNGHMEAITLIEAGPCTVTQVKSSAKEGYNSVQLGFEETKKLNKAEAGHLKELGKFRHLREFRVDDPASVKVGDKVDVSLFQPGDIVNVTGVSKGKGYAGVVKRHHFHGGPKTHGQSDRNRAPGAIGSTTYPGHVLRGLRMAGHMGLERVTVRKLEVFKTDPAKNLIMIRGAVPGNRDGLLLISKYAGKAKRK